MQPRRRCWTRMRSTTNTDGDGGTPPAIFDRMAERYDDLRGPQEQLAEQFEFTIAQGLGAATRLLDVGCGTGALVAAAVERLGVRGWGVDASEPDAREGTGAARARRGLQARAGRRPPLPRRLVRRRDDASRRPRPGRAPRRRAVARHAAFWRRAGGCSCGHSRPSTSRATTWCPICPIWPRSTSRASRPPDVLIRELEAAGFGDVRVAAVRADGPRSTAPGRRSSCARDTSRRSTCSRRIRWRPRSNACRAKPPPASRRSSRSCAGSSSSRSRSRNLPPMETRSLAAARPFTTKDGSTIRELFGLPTGGTVLQSLAESRLPAGGRTQRHYHAVTEEIYFILEGRADMELNGAHAELGPGEAVAIPPGAWHEILRPRKRRTPLPLLLRPAVPARRHLLRVARRASSRRGTATRGSGPQHGVWPARAGLTPTCAGLTPGAPFAQPCAFAGHGAVPRCDLAHSPSLPSRSDRRPDVPHG